MRVLVLGAGFGGLELATRLSDQFGADADAVLINQADGFVFGFSKLDVMFGKALPTAGHHPYRDLVKPGVRFVQSSLPKGKLPSWPTRSRQLFAATHHRRPTTATACATSSSAITRSQWST